MRHISKYLFLVTTCLTLLSLFFHCKKYPENKGIHLTNPEKRIIGEYIMTEYTVNDYDSLPLLSSQFNRNISNLTWNFSHDHYRDFVLYSSDHTLRIPGTYAFVNKKKDLKINFYLEYYNGIPVPGTYNPFLEKQSTWEILKLYKKNNKPTLKIKRELNGKTYVIQFN